jgi:hypothetical protein
MLFSLGGRRWRFLWGMLLQQQIGSSSPNYELLNFTSVHCLLQSLLQWSPIAIPFVAYLHRYLHIHGDSFLKSYQTYTSHGISPLAPAPLVESMILLLFTTCTRCHPMWRVSYGGEHHWRYVWMSLTELELGEEFCSSNKRSQILQNQAFFFEKGRQDILPHCIDISDNEAQVTLQ